MSVEMQDLDLFVLLYADDMILFSESVDRWFAKYVTHVVKLLKKMGATSKCT